YSYGDNAYKIDKTAKSFDDYAHDVALQIKNIRIDSVAMIDANTKNEKNMTFTINRRVYFQKTRKFVLGDKFADTVIRGRTITFNNKNDSLRMASAFTDKITASGESVYKFKIKEVLQVAMAFDGDTVRI